MTDDPRLEAVARALATNKFRQYTDHYIYVNEHTIAFERDKAREFCVMIRAFLGEDAERKEAMPNRPNSDPDNAPAPVAAGADPPWLLQGLRAQSMPGPLPPGWTLGPRIDELLRDAARYRWLLHHARLIKTDQQWQTLPTIDDDQKKFTNQLIDAEIAGERRNG